MNSASAITRASEEATATFPVEGMSCASCVLRVERALASVPGVAGATVNLATEKATVRYDTTSVSPSELATAVENAGYRLHIAGMTARPGATEPAHSLPDHISQGDQRRRTAYAALRKDFSIAVLLGLPVMVYSMFSMSEWFMRIVPFSMATGSMLMYLATTVVVLIPGKRFYSVAWKLAKHRSADMKTLVALGTGAAYLYSSLVTLFPGWSERFSSSGDVYFDSTVTIITLVLLGKLLEARAKNKATDAYRSLLSLQPPAARVKRGKEIVELAVAEVTVGDIVLLRPGDRVPVDGTILTGGTAIDESMVTGESIPVEKSSGDKVIGGTINKNGSVEFRADAVGADTVIARIGKLIEDAQGSKAQIQSLADTIASVFVPVVLGISIVTFLLWFFLNEVNLSTALMNAISVLVIACPCALGLATPTAIIVGTSAGASIGLLFKNAESLERLHKADTIIFDKTGTLSRGVLTITDVIPAGQFTGERILRVAASLERNSGHPISTAIVEYARSHEIEPVDVLNFSADAGKGISGTIGGERVVIGTRQFLQERSVRFLPGGASLDENEAGVMVYVAIDGIWAGTITLEDSLKPSAKEVVARLRAMKYRVVLLTGDRPAVARRMGEALGIDEVVAGMLPHEKAEYVRKREAEGRRIVFVGDGVNDAPALAAATAGIAIGTGTDVAKEAADILLVRGDLNGISSVLLLSKRVIAIIRQNLFWAFVYNTIGIPLAAFGALNPMFASAAMALSSVSVISNSLRLRNVSKIG